VSNELIIRYLLGDLPAEEQAQIEDRAFDDQTYLENIVSVEDDLIDSYITGEISASERAKFENSFFSSERRRKKVEFARTLAKVTADERSNEAVSPVFVPQARRENSLIAFLRSLQPTAALSLAAAVLVVLVGGGWLVAETIRLRSELNQLRAQQQSGQTREKTLAEQLAKERTRSEELAAQLQREQHVPEQAPQNSLVEPTSPLQTVVSLVLGPMVSRSGNERPKLQLSEGVRTARLQVGIDPQDNYPRFQVEVLGPAGRAVWSNKSLAARTTKAGRSLFVSLPASVLKPGSYEVAIKGITEDGKTEDVAFHYFDVVKK